MQETPVQSPPAVPFDGEPSQLAGCGKPAVIGCLVLLLLLVIGLLVLMWKAQDILSFALNEYRAAIESSLPDDLSAEERERLARAFDAAIEAFETGDIRPEDAQLLQRALSSPPTPGERLDRQQVLELIERLEAIGAGRSSPQAKVNGGALVVARSAP